MKKIVLYIFILILPFGAAIGQTRAGFDSAGHIQRVYPLIFVDSLKTDINHFVLNPQKIESIQILKDAEAVSKFGNDAKEGVIIIRPKLDVQLLRVEKIFDKFKIGDADRTLRICINKNLVKEPQLILIEDSEIEDVQITTDRHWINSEEANSEERFINIITKAKN